MLFWYGITALVSVCSALAADETDSTSTLTIQSFVTVFASPPMTSASVTSSNGLGDYIMQGLSDSSVSSTAQVLPGPVTAPFPSKNATAAVGWEVCQTSQISWSNAWTSAYQPEVVTRTYTNTNNEYTVTYNVTLGNSDVYTTIDGIPHAHGELEPPSTSQFVEVYSETSVWYSTYTTSVSASFTNPTPKCTIAPSKCTALWETYLEEHGMPTTFENATEPAITPVPTDRPRCSVGDVTAKCQPIPTPSCVLIASKVDLYYWPSITAAPNASLALTNSSEIVTQVVGNITMTSPSVYLVFDHLQAMSSTDLDLKCSLSSPLGATGTVRWAGGGAIKSVGGPYTNAVVSLDATGLSSLVRDLGAVNTASVVSEIAHGGPSYSHWINAVRGTGRNYGTGYYSSVMAKSVDYADFMVPDAEAYYMNINGAPGCNRMGDHPQCSTIYDGAYKAQLLVPKEVRTLRPEWAECFDPLFGALDPPIALTQVATIKTPGSKPAPIALTPVDTIETPEHTSEPGKETPPKETPPSDPPKQTDPATPGNTVPSGAGPTVPPSKSSPTALPATNPDDGPSDQAPGNSDDKPANDDKPSNSDTPSDSDKPSNNDSPSNDGKPSDGDSSNDNGDDSSNAPPQNGNSADEPQNGPSGSSSSDDQNPASGGNSDKEPQNALDVLTAAQQSAEAKATASPDSENSSGNGGSANSGGSNDEDGASGAAGSNSKGDSSAQQGQSSVGDSNGDESSGNESNTNNQNSDVNNSNDAKSGSGTNGGPAEQVVNIDGKTHTIAEQNGVTVIDGTPLPTDGSPLTVDGQSVSAVNGGVVIGTQTVDLTGGQTADSQAAVFTANGQAFTAVPGSKGGVAVVYGTTLSVGGEAATVQGATISAASNGVIVDGSTIEYEDASSTADSQAAVFTVNGQAFTAVAGSNSGIAVVDGTTLSVGGQAATLQGATISAAANGIVVDGSTIEYEDASSTASPAVLTFGSNVATASAIGSDVFAIGTVTLTAGGSDATISGHTVSAASTGVVIDGSSSSTDAGETRGPKATQTTSTEQGGQSPAAGSEASKLHVMHWAALLGIGLLLLL